MITSVTVDHLCENIDYWHDIIWVVLVCLLILSPLDQIIFYSVLQPIFKCTTNNNIEIKLTPFSVRTSVWCLPQATSITLPMSSVFTGVLVIIILVFPSSATAQCASPQLSLRFGVNWLFQVSVSGFCVIFCWISGQGLRLSMADAIWTNVDIRLSILVVCKVIYVLL